jgi:hypothetical protein
MSRNKEKFIAITKQSVAMKMQPLGDTKIAPLIKPPINPKIMKINPTATPIQENTLYIKSSWLKDDGKLI